MLLDDTIYRKEATRFSYLLGVSDHYNKATDKGAYYWPMPVSNSLWGTHEEIYKSHKYIYSEIEPTQWFGYLEQDPYTGDTYEEKLIGWINKMGGIYTNITKFNKDVLVKHIYNCTPFKGKKAYNAITATGLKRIVLDGPLSKYSLVDTDDDTLLDWNEVDTKSGLIKWDSNGEIILPTLQQCINYKSHLTYVKNGLSRLDNSSTYMHYVLNYTAILPILSDPTSKDGDGDGLLDGKATYVNSKKVAPKDPDPLKKNGPENAWKTHIAQIESGENLATDYSNDYYENEKFEAEIKFWGILPYLDNNLIEVLLSSTSELGSKALDFRYDDKHIALHSDTTQWQSLGGYNDFYDYIFNVATSMNKLKLDFNSNNQDYVVWAWKGNYLNLGAGSEVGFYTKSNTIEEYTGLEQWMVDKEFPMTLSLYKIVGIGIYLNYYNWLPDMEQWWITGFVPNIYDYTIKADELLQIASVDFSNEPEMLSDLKTKYEQKWQSEYLIFDEEDNMLWIMW